MRESAGESTVQLWTRKKKINPWRERKGDKLLPPSALGRGGEHSVKLTLWNTALYLIGACLHIFIFAFDLEKLQGLCLGFLFCKIGIIVVEVK